MSILRENGDKQLRGFHNAAPAKPCHGSHTVSGFVNLFSCQDLQDLKGALRVFCRVRPCCNCTLAVSSESESEGL